MLFMIPVYDVVVRNILFKLFVTYETIIFVVFDTLDQHYDAMEIHGTDHVM